MVAGRLVSILRLPASSVPLETMASAAHSDENANPTPAAVPQAEVEPPPAPAAEARPPRRRPRASAGTADTTRSPDHKKPKEREDGKERSPRRVGPEAKDMAADDDPEASVLDSELSDINAEWTKDCPGQGCTLEDLRWYVVREIGEIK